MKQECLASGLCRYREQMGKIASNNSIGALGKREWLRRRLVPLFALLFVIAVMVGIFYFYKDYPDRAAQFVGFGYLGAFLISLTFNATIILPAGNVLVLAALGATLPSATMVGIAGGAGAAIGEITGYVAGYSGRSLITGGKRYRQVEGWVKRWGIVTIFALSLFPFIFDLAGIAAGVLRFPLWKFLVACWLGRTILYIVIALAGAHGWEAVFRYFG